MDAADRLMEHHEKKTRLEKIAARTHKLWGIDEKLSLLKTHPPRICCADKKLTVSNTDGSPLATLDNSALLSPDYWAFMRVYEPASLDSPRVLVNLDTLAKIKSLNR